MRVIRAMDQCPPLPNPIFPPMGHLTRGYVQGRLHEIQIQAGEIKSLTTERDNALHDASCWKEAATVLKSR